MSEEAPRNWQIVKLEEISEIVRGLAFPTTDKSFTPSIGTIACLRTTNVQREVEWDDLWFIPAKHVRHEGQLVRIGDILISTANSFELVGKVAQVKSLPYPATLGAFISLIRPDERLSKSFLFYQLTTPTIQSDIRDMASTTTNISNVSTGKLRELRLSLAPLAEQCRIVDEIDKQFTRLDAATAALKRVQANLKRYRASVLKATCEGRLVPTEAELARREGRDYEPADKLLQRILRERRARWEADTFAKMQASGKPPKDDLWRQKYKEPSAPDASNLPPLPEGWCWGRAEQLCGFITKGTTPSANKLFDAPGDIPFIKVYNLTFTGRLDFDVNPTYIGRQTHEQELARSRVVPGDILMNIVGPPLGKVSVVPDLHEEWNVNQAIAIFRTIEGIEKGYLAGLLMTEQILRWATQRAKATAGQFNLTLEICRDLPIPLPPIAEQKRIVAELDRQITYLEKTGLLVDSSSARAQNARQSILSSAFTGQLVSQHSTDEPASALLGRIRAERGAPVMQNPARRSRKEPAHV